MQQDSNDQNQTPSPSVSVGGTTGEPVASVTVAKEHGPVANTSEFIKPSEQEPQITKDLAESGVEVVSSKPPQDNIHVRATGDVAPVQTSPTGVVVLPMTKQQATQAVKKNKNVRKSILWLATVILRQFKRQEELKEGLNG